MEVWGGNCQVDRSFEMPGLHTWVYSRPFGNSGSGGDVYYVSSCASGRITRLLLADVSGHGPEVSDLALGLRDLMRQNVNVVKQTRFIEGMNQQFTKLSATGSFATALVATFFQPTRRLTLCNAGHPAPLHYDRQLERWSRVESPSIEPSVVTGTPLGVFDEARYPQVEMKLSDGDMVLLFSDALIESQIGDGTLRGEDGLLSLVNDLDLSAPQEFLHSVINGVAQEHPGRDFDDDVTALLVQATGTSTRWSDNLMAIFRLLRGVDDHTILEPRGT
jgi:serine phosphatase RsbU (regulator of sigma subunit)